MTDAGKPIYPSKQLETSIMECFYMRKVLKKSTFFRLLGFQIKLNVKDLTTKQTTVSCLAQH